jgi:hypothetical protein
MRYAHNRRTQKNGMKHSSGRGQSCFDFDWKTRRNEFGADYTRDAEQWLREKEAEAIAVEQERFRKVLAWAIIAAVMGILATIASWIAAWPIIKGWFG